MHPHHTPDVDFAAHADELLRGARLWSQVSARIVSELPVPDGAVVADIGCGAGELALLFARRAATVYAVDREDTLLELVRGRAASLGVDTVRTVRADLDGLPDALPEQVHLAWAGHVVHHAGDQLAALVNLAATLLPGGLLAVGEGGLSPRSLPLDVGLGEPGLQARLEVALNRWFTAMRAGLPGSVREPRGWPALLRAAGLVDVTARGWLLHRPAPLSTEDRDAVLQRLASNLERARPWVSDEDAAAWDRLLDPADVAWLGHRDDLEVLAVETVHLGRRAS